LPVASTPTATLERAATCPLCGAGSSPLLETRGYSIMACGGCLHQFADYRPGGDHVGRVFGDAYFTAGGAGYPGYLDEEKLLRARGARYARLLSRFMPPGRVLDVGAAAGFLLQGFLDAGWNGDGLEPNGAMAALARGRGLSVEQGTLEQLRATGAYDLVLMVQVLGHVVDPRRALEAAARATRPSGFWLVETWNPRSWIARLLGAAWHEYSPPAALHYFCPAALDAVAVTLGFEPVARGAPLRWIRASHAKALLRHAAGAAPASFVALATNLLPDRSVLPYFTGDLYWKLYRKRPARRAGGG
jgi:SAM-dependent methyltransferase